jgi:predicted acetyltransferase
MVVGVKLILPLKKLEKEFKKIILEYEEDDDLLYYTYMEGANNFEGYLKRLKELRRGIDLPKGDVPTTDYWLVDEKEKEICGMIKIRHESISIHGNISYDIPLKKRFLGYGTKILQLGIKKARELGIEEIRVSCGSDNDGSRKIILRNNAFFIGLAKDNDELYEQYQIK